MFSMKSVAVKFITAEVAAYNARDEHLEVRLVLNDGKDKQFLKQLRLESPAAQAEGLISEVRDKLKKAHGSRPTFDDDPLSGLVHIRWTQDEENVHERLAKFLAALHERVRNAKRKGLSYYDLERQMMASKTSFD
jgi:hypothetical protein